MANLTPIQLIQMVKSSNPRQVAEQLITQYYPNNPVMQQMLQLAQQGNSNGVKQIAQQMLQQQGLDLESGLNQLSSMMNMLGK